MLLVHCVLQAPGHLGSPPSNVLAAASLEMTTQDQIFVSRLKAKVSTGVPLCFQLDILFLHYRQAKYISSMV